ncbi:histidine kinase [Clostridium aestuarii]|uniref:histidine kinase n=1 Tax=Clostridium aestuarii TaxID=338193 RepID=A0ABT4CWQ7_9CLOT|nr:histidine kinase [Clostridium aestuarii]MCY6483433.1 histidine kinase [Clostridium aestuarii]
MEYIFRLCFYSFIIAMTIIEKDICYFCIVSILIIMIIDILIERYIQSKIMVFIQAIIIIIISFYKPVFIIFLGACSYELIKRENYFGVFFIVPIIGFLKIEQIPIQLLIFFIVNIYGYIYTRYMKEQKKYKTLYDNERRTRYELEETKNRLIQSAVEVEHLAEIKERNRIAREIHDTVGHNIAGIYMQLQAAAKIRNKDTEKSYILVDKSINELSKSLSLLRETVHNIKPMQSIGINYIIKIIEEFNYCKVNFKYIGDFNNISSSIMQIISTNIKEALTNASMYSMADIIDINLEVNEKYIRLYIKDNGIGCESINEGLGISGMKERIKNIGGNIAIDSKNGFLIVCIIPMENLEVNIFENYNS